MQTFRGISILAGLLLMSSVSWAVDGVVLISQSGALAGNVTPGDAPGFPVTISQPGSYRLSGNLTVPNFTTTAIQITASNVTLDLNGFSILGPNICTPIPNNTGLPSLTCTAGNKNNFEALAPGITDSNPNPSLSPQFAAQYGITILSGTIQGMGGNGIFLAASSSVLISNVHAISNGADGIFIRDGIIKDSTAELNQSGGFVAQFFATVTNVVAQFQYTGTGIALGGGRLTNSFIGSNATGLFGPRQLGYSGNVFQSNTSTFFNGGGGTNLGQNLCDLAACPSAVY